jgi:hypothetical protein
VKRATPLLKISNDSERRKIERSNFDGDPLFRAHLKIGDFNIDADITDISSAGVGLRLAENDMRHFQPNSSIDELFVYYGKSLLCEAKNPKVVNLAENRIGVSFVEQGSRFDRRAGRLIINPTMEPAMFAVDPIDHQHLLHLRVLNISMKGMLASTSISNRNIMPGVILKNTMILPGVGLVECELRVRNVKVQDKRTYLGCEFVGTTKKLEESIARFALIGGENKDLPPEMYAQRLKELNFPLSSIGVVTRLVRVSTKAQYEDMLRVRFAAYKAAAKVPEGWTAANMADEFDVQSFNYIGVANGISFATFRMTVCDHDDEHFPFESHEPFDAEKVGFARNEVFEVSKLAILPDFQKTDIVLSLFRKIGIETVKHKKGVLLLSTKALRRLYFKLGAKLISEEYPHPLIAGETLSLLVLPVENYMNGQGMSGLSWELLSKFVKDHFDRAGVEIGASAPSPKGLRAKFGRLISGFLSRRKK